MLLRCIFLWWLKLHFFCEYQVVPCFFQLLTCLNAAAHIDLRKISPLYLWIVAKKKWSKFYPDKRRQKKNLNCTHDKPVLKISIYDWFSFQTLFIFCIRHFVTLPAKPSTLAARPKTRWSQSGEVDRQTSLKNHSVKGGMRYSVVDL